MTLFETIAVLITLSALFSYVNLRSVKLPTTIGVMTMGLALSLLLLLLGTLGLHLEGFARTLLEGIDFSETLMQGMLAFLLFAGSLHVDLSDLAKQKWLIGWLATAGVIGSTFLVGALMWLFFWAVGFEVAFLHCLLFGAIVSPTDPIAVLGILKKAGVPKSLEVKITGESLFNDGVGVVVFLILLEIVRSGQLTTFGHIGNLFLLEVGGGILFGLSIGLLAFRLLRSIDNYQVEILITLALVSGGYALANRLHISGPIAIVVSGLLIGNKGRLLAMSQTTVKNLDTFWELTDEILNAVLFLLIGLELLLVEVSLKHALIMVAAIPSVLLARWLSVGGPVSIFRLFRSFSPGIIRVLTWGGLRGGISVALALSLPPGEIKDLLLPATYAVVVFSILVQGLTVGRILRPISRVPTA